MMKNNISFVYASDANLSGFRANAIHVMKICNSFAELCEEVTLFCIFNNDNDIYEKYGVTSQFGIKSSFNYNFRFLPDSIKCLISGFINAIRINCCYKNSYVHGRSLWTLYFLNKNRNFSYEVHSIPSKKIYEILESKILKRSNLKKLVTISEPLRKEYSRRYPELSEKIKVLHDGADPVPLNIQKALLSSKDTNDLHIGYVGSLYPGKCMETLIPIATMMPDIYFHIVGGSKDLVNYWKSECVKNRINNIIFYGYVKPSEINSYYQAFDVVLLPYSKNIYYRKGKSDDIGKWISPLKLFEAMSNQKPIIVTSLNSIREILEDGKDAFIIESDDINKWVNTLRELISNASLRNRLGKNALNKFRTYYTWKKRAEQILD